MLKNAYSSLKGFLFKIAGDNVSTYSAQASFFIILSLFPFIMLLLTLIKYTALSKGFLLSQALDIMPDAIDPLIKDIIDELYSNAGRALISFSAIAAIWSASRGALAMIRGLNSVYHIVDKRNYFVIRFIASIYTGIFLIAIILSLALLVFGRKIYLYLEDTAIIIYELLGFILKQRLVISIVLLTLLFIVIYKALPAKKYSFFTLLPGAIFSAFGWIGSSFVFSIYFTYFPDIRLTYGSLTTFILLMLWIYVGMYILFIGAEINIYFKSHFTRLYKKLKD